MELLDLLADTVLVQDEVLGPEIQDGTALLVDDTDIDLDDVGLRLEPGPGRTGRDTHLSCGRVATQRREAGASEKDGEASPCGASAIPSGHVPATLRRAPARRQ